MYDLLAGVQSVARTRLAGEPGAGPDAFADAKERAARVVEAADRMLASYSRGAAATWARYARAEALLELGRAEEAAEDAAAVVASADRDSLVGGLAGALQARAEEARGNLQRAADLYGEVAAGAAGSFPPEAALLHRARCLNALGSRQDAISTYQEIVDRYPESPLAAKANRKLDELREAAEGT
jgi:outer membrane protein assembly factor BamD (BamD/ComL family)